jgi:spore maturation protein CgeB
LKLVIFGLSITSSWGNGHATTYRALTRALHARGHKIVFFERNEEWYAGNRDLPEPEFCQVHLFKEWDKALPTIRRELRDCDVAMVGSYFKDGIQATEELSRADVPVKSFYDKFRASTCISVLPAARCCANWNPDSARAKPSLSTVPLILKNITIVG